MQGRKNGVSMRKIVVYLNDKILEGFSVDDDVKDEDITDESLQEVLSHLDWHWEEVDKWPEELGGKGYDQRFSKADTTALRHHASKI